MKEIKGKYNLLDRPLPIIVAVDDEQPILSSLRRVIDRLKYRVETFTDPNAALDFIRENKVHVVISDMRMPIMMGQDFLAKVFEIQPSAYRVVLTGYADIEATLDVVNRGGISAFLQKPWETDHLTHVVVRGVEHTELIFENERLNEQVRLKNTQLEEVNASLEEKVNLRTKQIRAALMKLEGTYSANLHVMFNMMSAHPNIDGDFAKKVSKMARKIAGHIDAKAEFINDVGLAAMMCELGFIGLEPDLLNIPFRAMNAAQLKEFKRQVYFSNLILAPAPHLNNVAVILREQYRGFLPMLDEEPPGLGAQIISVVRDYQRMLDGRYQAQRMPVKKAIAELVKHRGNRYSPEVVDLVLERPEVLDTTPKQSNITIDQLEPGMVLVEDLLTEGKMLLLPEGHVFTPKTVARIKQFQASLSKQLPLVVIAPEHPETSQ